MSNCCSRWRKVVVEVHTIDLDGPSCRRCLDTVEAARQAVAELRDELEGFKATVELVEHHLGDEHQHRANTVLVAGRPLAEWLGAEVVMTPCPDCRKDTCCEAISVGEGLHESVTAEDVRYAVFEALAVA